MQLTIQYAPITELFRQAHAEGRDSLLEHEVYALLGYSGAETPPRHIFLSRDSRPVEEACLALPGEKTVLKIVSPFIVHKTELGGVRIIPKSMDKIRSAMRRMLCEVPERYADWLERHPQAAPAVYRGLSGAALRNAVSRDLRGVLQVQFMPPDSTAFGNELIVGLRRTREFGMVISAGLGGTDAELYAERFRKGQAIVAAPTALTDGQAFFNLFRTTVSYRKLAGLTRGQQRIVTDEQLIECFESFIRLGNHYSPLNDDAPFVIDELEINPFSFSDFLMTPLDGMCRFSLPQTRETERPFRTIHNLLHPRSIGIAGVSAQRRNFGRIILENILASGFDPAAVRIVRPDGGPVFLGANCMGVISRPGNYDTWFIPAAKLRQDARPPYRRVAIFSQSGAFLLNRYSQTPELRPAYLISLGNQTDLSLGDMMRYFRDSDAVDVIAVYVEGFRDLDGLTFARAVREAVCAGKQVIFYKAGRTPEGRSATSGHTASLAGDYMVCESSLRQSGAIVARTFNEFQDLVLLADAFGGMPIRGTRLGAVSGAGFEAVGMADNIQSEEYSMTLGSLSEETRAAMRALIAEKKLDRLVTVANPLDINPGADDETHARMAELMLADDTIDAVAIGLDPLSPVTHSLADSDEEQFRMDAPDGILARLEALRRTATKPLVAIVDGGVQFEPLRRALRERNIPTFPVCDRAVAALSLYMDGRLAAEGLRCSCPWEARQH